MTSHDDDRYLWDRSGPPDADVARLERVLAPLAHATGPAPVGATVAPRRRWLPLAATAAALLVAGGIATWALTRSEPPCATAQPDVPVVADGGDAIRDGEWVEATEAPREVRFGDLGRVTLDPGSRLKVARASLEGTRFFLERGSLEAFVSAAARPRFFEVETHAARCVDLGCRYVLSTDAAGVARVRVTTGQVAFEVPGREVYVPAGATCTARPGAGPGTPRFEDASPGLVAALDRFDASRVPGDRRARARETLDLVTSGHDSLVAWHLLGDADGEVAAAALERLTTRFGPCGMCATVGGQVSPEELAQWREHLAAKW